MQAKSARVEEATNELISMLLELEQEEDELDSDDEDTRKKDEESRTADGTEERKGSNRSHSGSSRPGSRGSRLGSAAVNPAAAASKRKREMRDYLAEEAQELLMHFNHRNIEAIVRVTRSTLDAMRRRVQVTSVTHHYQESSSKPLAKEAPVHSPLFRANVTLQIPNISMQPALDEVQQALNKAAQYVVSVAKGVSQWDKTCKALVKAEKKDDSDNEARSRSASNVGSDDESRSEAGPVRRHVRSGMPGADSDAGTVISMSILPQRLNYFRNVAENKEIAKLVSFLSTAINSQKKEVTTALEEFDKYQPVWKVDRDEAIKVFLESDPKLSEFEAEILRYKDLERTILKEPESYKAGAIALYTGDRKYYMTICAMPTCHPSIYSASVRPSVRSFHVSSHFPSRSCL